MGTGTCLFSNRNIILNQSISISEVICLTDPCHPLKECDLDTTNLLFTSLTALTHFLCLQKSLSLSLFRNSFLSARWGAAQYINWWRKSVRSFKFTLDEFCFITMLTFFCLFFSLVNLLLQESQPRTQRVEGKLFVFPCCPSL